MSFLSAMAEASRIRAAALDEAALLRAAAAAPRPPALDLGPFAVFAEVKFSSPSEGALVAGGADAAAQRATTYARSGAAAVSVLTEPDRFAGSLDHLRAVAGALRPVDVPAMRKDFLVDPRQVLEARVAGAGGVLLVAAILDDSRLAELLAACAEQGLFALVEAFDGAELDRIGRVLHRHRVQALVGLNSRDLRSLAVDPARHRELVDRLPGDLPVVAESGVNSAADALELAAMGYRGVLVGTALMRARRPGRLVARMATVGRCTRQVLVKICGLTHADDLPAAAEADAVGFVFADSPRRVSPARATELAALLPPSVLRVAVFHRASSAEIATVLATFPADLVQTEPTDSHGDPVRLPAGVGLLPVLHDGEVEPDLPAGLALLDSPGKGGRGLPADRSRARAAAARHPLFLAGGLRPDTVAAAITEVRPAGVDVSSGVESAPGRKDPALVRSFIHAARSAPLQDPVQP